MRNVDDATFEAEVIETEIPVLVDFWAAWCGPCRMLAPAIEELAKENGDKIKVCKANTEECPESSAKFGIRSIPTVVFFKDGKEVQRLIGVRDKAEYQKVIDQIT